MLATHPGRLPYMQSDPHTHLASVIWVLSATVSDRDRHPTLLPNTACSGYKVSQKCTNGFVRKSQRCHDYRNPDLARSVRLDGA
jgi:hypothetical protein